MSAPLPSSSDVEKHYRAVFQYEEQPASHSLPFVLDELRAAQHRATLVEVQARLDPTDPESLVAWLTQQITEAK